MMKSVWQLEAPNESAPKSDEKERRLQEALAKNPEKVREIKERSEKRSSTFCDVQVNVANGNYLP